MSEYETHCSNCCREIPCDEVQRCGRCLADGLGDCCIGEGDHLCEPIDDADRDDKGSR
jgi:hypothetical protein